MNFRFGLQNKIATTVILGLTFVCLGLLARTIFAEFVTGMLSDNRFAFDRNILRLAVGYFPDSGKLFSRLAQTESGGIAPDLEQAETHVLTAVEKLPNDYNNQLLLASIKDSKGEPLEAEQALEDALELAPNYSAIHWRMANLQLRQGNLEQALNYFQTAVALNPSLIRPALDVIWNVTDGSDLSSLKKIVENNRAGQIPLANFLINRDRIAEAAEILATADRETALSSGETPPMIYALINKKHPKLARDFWLNLVAPPDSPERGKLIWNGDFESQNVKSFEHFQWHLTHNDYARISIDDKESYSGGNALLLDFLGRDTTRLDTEVKQQIVARPGAIYDFEFYVKTENFRAPEGPRVVVSDPAGKWNVSSPPVAVGSGDWRRVTFTFTAPRTGNGVDSMILLVSIKRQPKFSYDEPTRGRIWFDDFAISERGDK